MIYFSVGNQGASNDAKNLENVSSFSGYLNSSETQTDQMNDLNADQIRSSATSPVPIQTGE